MSLHPLLLRQLRRTGATDDGAPPTAATWSAFLGRVSRSYAENDKERYLLERSQDLASQEMAALYATVRADRDLLDSRVRERTEALRVSEARLQSLLSLSADWVWEQDAELRFTFISDSVESVMSIPAGAMIGRQRMADDSFYATTEALESYKACVAARRAFRDFSYRLTLPDGSHRYIRVSGEPVFDAGGNFTGYRGVGRDVTARAIAEQKVQELARFDSLTGLPNRNMLLGELDRAIARARRRSDGFAVCFIDLDGFKAVNDTLGHPAGDELLVVVGKRLREALRETDLVARMGGDEFVVLLERPGNPESVSRLAAKVLSTLADPVTVQGALLMVTASMGVSLFPTDGTDAATLLKHADAAMYLAKDSGKNDWKFYTAELADLAAREFELESELRHALARDELVLHYQPKIDIASGRMESVEALIRWHHPKRGLVMPGEFVALAEERGLIIPIGRWVIRAACRQIHDWRQAGLAPPAVAVNLSARQFASDTLVTDLVEAMVEFGVLPAELEVELTESVLMTEPERANEVLQQLSEMGVKISIDDFGTGYSSLSYLKRFPARTVKIDRSFVKGLPADGNDIAITQAVIAMAHSLGLSVVAEGVESEAQLAKLSQLGCDEAQGYLLGRPMPPTELARRIGLAAGRTGPPVAASVALRR